MTTIGNPWIKNIRKRMNENNIGMDKEYIYSTFEVGDFVEICKGMSISKIIRYAMELMSSLRDLDLSPQGYYGDKVLQIERLDTFLHKLVFFLSHEGSTPANVEDIDLCYMNIIRENAISG